METLKVSLVLEVLGRPPENLTRAINSIVDRLSKEKDATLKDKTIHEPTKIENANDLYTSFAEVELEIKSISTFFYLIFAYMPSHIELSHPEKISMKNSDINELVNVLTQRLHTYDSLAKAYLSEKEYIFRKVNEVSPETYKKVVELINKEAEEKKSKAASSQQT